MKHSEESGAEPSRESDAAGRLPAVGAANSSRWIAPAGLAAGVVALALALVHNLDGQLEDIDGRCK